MRVEIVRAPLADIDVVGAGAVLGQRLLAVTGQDLDVDAGTFGGLLEGLGDALHRLGGAHVDRDLEAFLQAGLLEQFLGPVSYTHLDVYKRQVLSYVLREAFSVLRCRQV